MCVMTVVQSDEEHGIPPVQEDASDEHSSGSEKKVRRGEELKTQETNGITDKAMSF